jgi:hypothetical protein
MVATLALATAFHVAPALAQSARTFVSGHGSDGNPCTLASPCRGFARAVTQTAAGGEIDVLDPAGYGAVTITQAVSIVNDGVGTSSVLVPPPGRGGVGITINAGPSDAVHLRGLTIDGEGAGVSGIQFNSGGSLTVVNCVIRHNTSAGILFVPIDASNLFVSNTLVNDNAGGTGILIQAGLGTAGASLNHVETDGNAIGVAATTSGSGALNVAVSDSVASGNSQIGFKADDIGSGAATLLLFHVVAANNNIGVQAAGSGPSSTASLAQSTVTGNANGWEAIGNGSVLSYADNYIDGNGANETAPPTATRK